MNRSSRGLKVLVIVANVKQYRVPFYYELREYLARRKVDLRVVYSDPDPVEAKKKDSVELPSPIGKKVGRTYIWRDRVLVQYVPLTELISADLIIVIQASSYLINYPLLILSYLGAKKVALWGHGLNRQGDPKSISERLKRMLAVYSSWWFAYTPKTKEYLATIGVADRKITTVENAIDTRDLVGTLQSITEDEIVDLKRQLGLGLSSRVAIYCGSIYAEKKIEFLLECAAKLSQIEPDFCLLIVGSGAQEGVVKEYAAKYGWLRYAGPLFGRDKARYLRISEIFMCPGLVGLAVLDSFAAGLPVLTTADALHSPEIEYLEHGVNGFIVEGGAEEYTRCAAAILASRDKLATLSSAARASAARHTIQNMANNFGAGICSALGLPN